MKNALLFLAGGLAAYGVWYCWNKNKKPGAAPAAPGMAKAAEPVLTITETTEAIPAYGAMIGHYDARPEALFAPPKAYVAVNDPSVTGMITTDSFGNMTQL